jgi:hypothetical protein
MILTWEMFLSRAVMHSAKALAKFKVETLLEKQRSLEEGLTIVGSEFSPTVCKLRMRPQNKFIYF